MLLKPTDWQVVRETPTKRVLRRYDLETESVIYCEEFFEDPVIEQARLERDNPLMASPDLKPMAVIPPSEINRSMREGWYHDKDAWRKWAANIDNNKLKTG